MTPELDAVRVLVARVFVALGALALVLDLGSRWRAYRRRWHDLLAHPDVVDGPRWRYAARRAARLDTPETTGGR